MVGALAAVGLLIADVAGLVLIREYQLGRIDDQLRGMTRPFAADWRPTSVAAPPRTRVARLGPDRIIYVYRADGTLDPQRSSTADPGRPLAPALNAVNGGPFTLAAADGDTDWRVIGVRDAQTGGAALIGLSLAEVHQTTEQLMLIEGGVSVLVLALLGLGAAFVVRLGLRPLTEMERLATAISAGNLSSRVPDDPHTEPGRLGLALNSMLTRIESEVGARTASEQRLRQFVADASHELRTPLTSIQGFAELYRRGGAPPGPALNETMSRIESEAVRMGVLVEDLLLLARLDRQRPPTLRRVDLLEVAADTIRDAHARTPERPVRLAGLDDDSDTFEPATVLGDEHGLRQVATNLVANALRHTPVGVRVTVRVGCTPARRPSRGSVLSGSPDLRHGPLAVLEVSDDGPGVPAEHASRVFERLYRADVSRTRAEGGSGLGLSIAATIVHSHGGWVELDSPVDGGAVFRVLLPAVDEAA
ncbi:sensor histidine kinase [Micromonospora sp. NPDC051543]|uniref:sensor histidine kinase n=1 Tax=Micromonospora sp. NPDC051543 TaxID=3364287 RepID=UPI0037974A01